MDLTSYTDQLREDLLTAAALGDERTRQTAAALATAVEPATRLILLQALSDLAAEITATLDDTVVEVRMDGTKVRAVVERTGPDAPAGPHTRDVTADVGGDISRVTLRMVEQVKARAEEAATRDGVSLNAWLAQTVQGALGEGRPRGRGGEGSTLRGWVQG